MRQLFEMPDVLDGLTAGRKKDIKMVCDV